MLGPAVLRHRDFRLFSIGALLSATGTQFTTVAMAWQIYQLTNSPLQVGLLGLGRAIPQITMAIFGGLLADNVDRRRLMIAVQALQCVVSSALAVMTIAGLVSPGVLFACAVAFALGSALETPNRQAIVPNLVPGEELSEGIALTNTLRNVATIAGPSLAGLTLAVSSATTCYMVDAASWLAMIVALLFIRRPLQTKSVRDVSLRALFAGIAFVRTQRVILCFMVLDFGATLFGSPVALFPVFARDLLHAGPVGLGLLYAGPSIGAVVAGLAFSTRLHVDRAGAWVIGGVAIYGAANIAFGLSRLLWLSVLMLVITGMGNAVSAVLRNTSNQLLTPDALRGRVAAVNSAFVTGGPQLGQFESGTVAQLGGAELAALTGGLGALLLAIGIGLVPAVRYFTLSEARERARQESAPVVPV